jgi:hypothetical protein
VTSNSRQLRAAAAGSTGSSGGAANARGERRRRELSHELWADEDLIDGYARNAEADVKERWFAGKTPTVVQAYEQLRLVIACLTAILPEVTDADVHTVAKLA